MMLFCYLAGLIDEIPELGRADCDFYWPLVASAILCYSYLSFFVPSLFKNGFESKVGFFITVNFGFKA